MSANTDRWGPWTPWEPCGAEWPPADALPGVLVEADLITRADWLGLLFHDGRTRPHLLRHSFVVSTGEAFLANPPWTPETSHLVTQYRVWNGTPESYDAWLEEITDPDRLDTEAPGYEITDDSFPGILIEGD